MEKRKEGTESLFEEIMDENFLNMRKEMDIQIQEAQRTPISLGEPKEAHTKPHFK